MENLNAATATLSVSAAPEATCVAPRNFRKAAKRPRMNWEYSLAETASRPRPAGNVSYIPYYMYGERVELKNGMAVI